MATKLRRCLYIGLGGTGINTLLHTKKMFMETYGGEVPSMIGFLGIDTDGGAFKKSIDSKYGSVTLNPSQQCSIACKDAPSVYSKQKDHFTWVPEENEGAIVAMEIGAGQVRSNGRLALIVNYSKVKVALRKTLDSILAAENSHNKEYELISNNVEIHMVFSICGGTGCGTFIDMAYLIRKVEPECKLTGYAVLPDVFESMVPAGPAMAKVKPNAYGAIYDLDWLMHLKPSSHPVNLDYITQTESTNLRPFNAVMFIDNANENKDVYSHVNQLTEMISLSLVIAAGSLSVQAASVSDNIEKYYADGSMDIEDKKAWAAGMGACEIVFKGNDVAEIYALKAAQRIIHRLMNSCNDIDVIVNNWIDKPEVQIRENNGFDNVIDFILNKRPRTPMTGINEPSDAKQEVEMYISTALPKDKETQEKIKELNHRVTEQLKAFLIKHINQECGVSDAENIILSLQKQVTLFANEMKDELEELENNLSLKKQTIQITIDNLSELARKTFVIGRKGKIDGLTEEVIAATATYVEAEREIIRRRGAITFYNGLQAALYDEHTSILNTKKILLTLHTAFSERLAEIYNQVGKSGQTFRIDLASETAKNVMVDDNQLNLHDFINTLPFEDRLYSLSKNNVEDVKHIFYNYTVKLPAANKWGTTGIDDILDHLTEEDFNNLMKIAVSKAMPLFRKDYQGHIADTELYEGYYVGIPNENHSRLKKGNNFKNMQQGTVSIDFVPTGMNDRIIIYRQLGVVPAYAIAPLKMYKDKYDRCRTNCHFDMNVLLRMEREDFSLQPKQQDDDSLELWVYGILFGLIKNENGSYYYKSQTLGDPLFDNWVKMNLQYRDEAFDYFRHHRMQIRKEFNEYIDEEERSKGLDAMKEFKADVKLHYLQKYSQLNMTPEELTKRGNEKIADLARKEIVFVQRNL